MNYLLLYCLCYFFFFFKQKTAYEMRISDWSSDVCSSDLFSAGRPTVVLFWATWCPYCKALMPHLQSMLDEYGNDRIEVVAIDIWEDNDDDWKSVIRDNGYDFRILLKGDALAPQWQVSGTPGLFVLAADGTRSEEHTSELQSLMRNSYAVF